MSSHTFKFTHNNNIINVENQLRSTLPHKSEKNSKSLLAFLPTSNRVQVMNIITIEITNKRFYNINYLR